MIRLYLANTTLFINQTINISGDNHHYLFGVMRSKIGDLCLIFNGIAGEFSAKITLINKKYTELLIINKTKEQINCPELCVIFAPLKAHRLTFLIEKATELGVTKFIPITTQHSYVREININKLALVAIAAAQQCHRMDVPIFMPMQKLEDFLATWQKQNITLCYEKEQARHIMQARHSNALMIGPEGGFSQEECLIMSNYEFIESVHLGMRILRAETAALMSLSYFNFKEQF
jgi:16S rRNA (uracil1498-N3)-methyltransferase